MAPRYVKRTSDGSTIDVIEEEAEQADTTANARRTLLVDSAGTTIKIVRSRENLAGSAGTGSDGDSDRVYSLTTSNSVDIVEVFLDGVLLIETTNYTINNTTKKVTMVSQAVFDVQTVSIFYNV